MRRLDARGFAGLLADFAAGLRRLAVAGFAGFHSMRTVTFRFVAGFFAITSLTTLQPQDYGKQS